MSAQTRVVNKRRATITALPLYYSGQLLKKNSSEKDFKNYYGELRGATLFLYHDESQDTDIEKLDLEQLASMESNCPYQRKTPTIFTLSLHTEKVQLRVDNPYTGEEWRAYILTMFNKEIPGDLQLLPGQMMLLLDALERERERRRNSTASQPPLPPRPSFLPSSPSSPTSQPADDHPDYMTPDPPACFFNVTRQEAERMLEANPENGGIILRPSSLSNIYAVTIRQLTPRGPVMRNFRVACTDSGFVIELLTPVTVSSIDEVLKYFIEKTQRLPYATSEPYDFLIEVPPAPNCISITSPASKKVPKARVAPILRPQILKELDLPLSKPAEDEYVVLEDHMPEYHNLRQQT